MNKEAILEKAKELFLKHGVKTIGMDDIANALHISKKTIYQYFSSKEELVKMTMEYVYGQVFGSFDKILGKSKTPIHEHFELVKVIDNVLGDREIVDSTCMFQLKKYYPEIKYLLEKKRYTDNRRIIYQNIEEGIKQGIYRENLDKEFISTMFFAGSLAFHYDEEFSGESFQNFFRANFDKNHIEYHLRAIVTPKGLKILENILENNEY